MSLSRGTVNMMSLRILWREIRCDVLMDEFVVCLSGCLVFCLSVCLSVSVCQWQYFDQERLLQTIIQIAAKKVHTNSDPEGVTNKLFFNKRKTELNKLYDYPLDGQSLTTF